MFCGRLIELYEAGETDIIEATLSAERLGMPAEIQAAFNGLRNDVRLPQNEAIKELNA